MVCYLFPYILQLPVLTSKIGSELPHCETGWVEAVALRDLRTSAVRPPVFSVTSSGNDFHLQLPTRKPKYTHRTCLINGSSQICHKLFFTSVFRWTKIYNGSLRTLTRTKWALHKLNPRRGSNLKSNNVVLTKSISCKSAQSCADYLALISQIAWQDKNQMKAKWIRLNKIFNKFIFAKKLPKQHKGNIIQNFQESV